MAQVFTVSLGESEGFTVQAQEGRVEGHGTQQEGNGATGSGEAMGDGGNVG